jgi:peptidoglycan biosynthesis protein MviN/MurJ (putative lipid II flippase)
VFDVRRMTGLMDTVYSLSLLVSLAAGVLGMAFCLPLLQNRKAPDKAGDRKAQIVLALGVATLISGGISAVVHRLYGHGQGSGEPMTWLQFLGNHKAYWIVLVLFAVVFATRSITKRDSVADD